MSGAAPPDPPPRLLSRNTADDNPEWLRRVQADERLALLRASSEFARTGYAPFLQKAKAADGSATATVRMPTRDGGRTGVLG